MKTLNKFMPVLIVLTMILSVVIFAGCGLKAMTPEQRLDELRSSGFLMATYIQSKRPDLIAVSRTNAEAVIAATSVAEAEGLIDAAWRFYLQQHPDDMLFVALASQIMRLTGVQVETEGIDIDTVKLSYMKALAEGYLDGLNATGN